MIQFTNTLDANGHTYVLKDGCVEVTCGYVYLPSLTTLPKGVTFNNRGCVDLCGLTEMSEGVTFSNSDHVDLSKLTAIPKGVTFNNHGGVYLRSLTAIPKGVTFNNRGGVDLRSLTTLPEGVTFSNSGYVDLSGLIGEYHTYQGKRIRLKIVDGFTMLILSERAGVCRAAYFGGGDLDKLRRCYVVKVGEYYAHGNTIAEAIRDAKLKQHFLDQNV